MYLEVKDILFAAILAFFITWIVLKLLSMYNAMKQSTSQFNYQVKDMNRVIGKCYALFPLEIFQFRGKTFKRGMTVRIKTLQNKIFEGKLVGINSSDVVCVLTNQYIVAHELSDIEEMENLN